MKLEKLFNKVLKKSFDVFKKEYLVLMIGSFIAVVGMIFIVTIPPLMFGIYYLAVNAAQGKKIEIVDVFKGFRYFFRSWGLAIVSLILVALGFVLLIVPGFLLIILFQYVVAVSLFENRGVFSSLKRSFQIGKENFLFSLILWLLLGAVSSIGAVSRLGFIISVPFSALSVSVATIILAKENINTQSRSKV